MTNTAHIKSIVKTISGYFDTIELQPDNQERIRIAGDMFSFIANNKDIFRFKKFKEKTKTKLRELYFDDHIEEVKTWWYKIFDEELCRP